MKTSLLYSSLAVAVTVAVLSPWQDAVAAEMAGLTESVTNSSMEKLSRAHDPENQAGKDDESAISLKQEVKEEKVGEHKKLSERDNLFLMFLQILHSPK